MERRFENVQNLRLDLRIPAGRMEITTADIGDAEIRLEPRTDAARELMGDVTVDLRRHGSADELVVEVPDRKGFGWFFGRGPDFALSVRCPHRTGVTAKTASADFEADGTLGSLAVKSASGDVQAGSVEGAANVQTASGDVDLGEILGSAEVTTASGDVEIRRAARGLRVNAVSGDVSVGAADGGVRVTSVSGDQRIEAVGSGPVELQSVSGDITLGLRRGLNVWMDVRTVSGDTTSTLTPTDAPPDDDAPLVELRVKSVSGDVRLEQAAAAAPVPTGGPGAQAGG